SYPGGSIGVVWRRVSSSFSQERAHLADTAAAVVIVGPIQAGFGAALGMHGGAAFYRAFDHLRLITKLDRSGRAGLGTSRYLIVDQTVVAQRALIGGALVLDVHSVPDRKSVV